MSGRSVRCGSVVQCFASVLGVERRRVLISSAAGIGFGAASSALNDMSSAYGVLGVTLAGTDVQSMLRVLSTMTGAGWAWAASAVAAGWYVRTRLWGAVAGASNLAAATSSYYAADNVLRTEPIFGSDVFYWLAAGALLGPLLGVVGAYIRRPGAAGLFAALTVPLGAAAQMVLLPQGVAGPQVAPEAVWARWLVGVTSVLVCARVVVRRSRGQKSVGRGRDQP